MLILACLHFHIYPIYPTKFASAPSLNHLCYYILFYIILSYVLKMQPNFPFTYAWDSTPHGGHPSENTGLVSETYSALCHDANIACSGKEIFVHTLCCSSVFSLIFKALAQPKQQEWNKSISSSIMWPWMLMSSTRDMIYGPTALQGYVHVQLRDKFKPLDIYPC